MAVCLNPGYNQAGQKRPDNNVNAAEDAEKIFDRVEVLAEFPGDAAGWRKFLESNLNGDAGANNGAPPGTYTVVLQFIVNKDGSLSDVRAITNHGFGLEQEALRVIRLSPKWIPGIQNGRQVRSYHKQPVTFVVEEQ